MVNFDDIKNYETLQGIENSDKTNLSNVKLEIRNNVIAENLIMYFNFDKL